MINRKLILVLLLTVLTIPICYYIITQRSRLITKTNIIQVVYAGVELPKIETTALEDAQKETGEDLTGLSGGYLGTGESLSENATLVKVTGSASIEVTPDLLILRISISATGKTAEEAVKNSSEIVSKVIDKLKDLGISEDNIETDYYYLMTVYDYEVKPPKIVGYKVIHILKVEVENEELAGTIIDEVSKFKIERITVSSSLSTESYKNAYLKALEQALSDALSKVEVIARTLNMEIRRIREVHESTSYGIIRYAKALEAKTEIYPEKVSVKCTVIMIVELTKD